jgi:hypothetical protein
MVTKVANERRIWAEEGVFRRSKNPGSDECKFGGDFLQSLPVDDLRNQNRKSIVGQSTMVGVSSLMQS